MVLEAGKRVGDKRMRTGTSDGRLHVEAEMMKL